VSAPAADLTDYGCVYSGWSPLLSAKLWRKELVGSGAARSSGAKNRAGSGSTVDAVRGKTGAPGDGGGG
jgi:hypothetical protein